LLNVKPGNTSDFKRLKTLVYTSELVTTVQVRLISQGNRAEISNQIHAFSAVGESYRMYRSIRLLNTDPNTSIAYFTRTIKLYLQSLKTWSLCMKTDTENVKINALTKIFYTAFHSCFPSCCN
jgi:hypothetical protein